MADFQCATQSSATPPKTDKQPPLDLSHHLSRVTVNRVGSQVKEFYKYFAIPGIGNLAGGLPNAAYFPYETLEAQIAQPERFKPRLIDPNDSDTDSPKPGKTSRGKPSSEAPKHLTVPHLSGIADPLREIDLTTALQYGTALGYPPLYYFLRQFTRENLHPNVPYLGGPDIILTNGSTDGLGKVIEALSNPWSEEKDWIREREGMLCEEFTFGSAIQAVLPRGIQVVPVKMDLEGMRPDGPGGLEDVLKNWDQTKGKRPHLMYTITIGQNPTSRTLSIQRRKELYAICSKYDVIIIEDDPYWFLQFPSAATLESRARNTPPAPAPAAHNFENSSGYAFLDSLVPSYLNVDTDGRVVRLDTFSKTVAPGCRLGWITAQPALIERLLRVTESSTQQPSGFVQSMIAELFMGPQPSPTLKKKGETTVFEGWQTAGLVRWVEGLRGVYERRMNVMCSALEAGRFIVSQHSPSSISQAGADGWAVVSKIPIYTFDWPSGGMFVWIHIHFDKHPLFNTLNQDGTKLSRAFFIFLTRKPYRCLVAPGLMFSPTEKIRDEQGWQYVRLCFAATKEDEVKGVSERFADGARAFWDIKDKKELDEIENEKAAVLALEAGIAGMGLGWGC